MASPLSPAERSFTRLHRDRLTPLADRPGFMRYEHASATRQFDVPCDIVFNVFSSWARYDSWAPELQGPAHWLLIRRDGVGSRFILYDKPGPRHLTHFGEVTAYDHARRFAWRAPFSDWPRLEIGTELLLTPTADGGCLGRETLHVVSRETHLPVLEGFLALPGYDESTMAAFLDGRLRGLAERLRDGLRGEDSGPLFTENRIAAADWPGRIPEGDWLRILHADGVVEFDAPVDVVFNAFTGFSRYADWTRMIHVGQEWLEIKAGGVGSTFLLWEKPGDRHVLHNGVVTESERNRRFTWRAPFSEYGKVFIGTSVELTPLADGRTQAYHVLYADLPADCLPIFAGFSSLHGFDLEFETFHIFEEARGLNDLLRVRAIPEPERPYRFDRDRTFAVEHPMQDGRRCPSETLTLQPSRILTYEDALLESVDAVTRMLPPPRFLRRYRDLRRTRAHAAALGPRHVAAS